MAGGRHPRPEWAAWNAGEPLDKGQMMAQRLAARLPMTLFTLDLATSKTRAVIEHSTDWLNHLQFSPVDPNFLMYCHEGSGWRVDRIWTIRTDGTQNTMIPDEPGRNRILETELAGHEWWSPDGRTIFVDLHFMKGVVGFLAVYNLDTGKYNRTTTSRTSRRSTSTCRRTGRLSAATAPRGPATRGSSSCTRSRSPTTRRSART